LAFDLVGPNFRPDIALLPLDNIRDNQAILGQSCGLDVATFVLLIKRMSFPVEFSQHMLYRAFAWSGNPGKLVG
jgi:hypothetical protein